MNPLEGLDRAVYTVLTIALIIGIALGLGVAYFIRIAN